MSQLIWLLRKLSNITLFNTVYAVIFVVLQPNATGELKTKPTQNSVRRLRELGLSADFVSTSVISDICSFIVFFYFWLSDWWVQLTDCQKRIVSEMTCWVRWDVSAYYCRAEFENRMELFLYFCHEHHIFVHGPHMWKNWLVLFFVCVLCRLCVGVRHLSTTMWSSKSQTSVMSVNKGSVCIVLASSGLWV